MLDRYINLQKTNLIHPLICSFCPQPHSLFPVALGKKYPEGHPKKETYDRNLQAFLLNMGDIPTSYVINDQRVIPNHHKENGIMVQRLLRKHQILVLIFRGSKSSTLQRGAN